MGLNKFIEIHMRVKWSRKKEQRDHLRGIWKPLGEYMRGYWQWNGKKKWVCEMFQQQYLNFSKSPWLIYLNESHTIFIASIPLTFPTFIFGSLSFCIFHLHDFLPNYLSSTQQNRAARQLKNLRVKLDLDPPNFLQSSVFSVYSENKNTKSFFAFTLSFGGLSVYLENKNSKALFTLRFAGKENFDEEL